LRLEVYVIIGEHYGTISVYFTSYTEAENYLALIRKLYSDAWRIIKLTPYGKFK
jgi:hypothetical protein